VFRIPFCQQIRLLMLILQEASLRGVLLAEDNMPDYVEAHTAPCVEELVGLRPAIERDHETVLLEKPVRFSEGRLEPVGVAVVLDRAILAIVIAD
jgi:hypothetical protein